MSEELINIGDMIIIHPGTLAGNLFYGPKYSCKVDNSPAGILKNLIPYSIGSCSYCLLVIKWATAPIVIDYVSRIDSPPTSLPYLAEMDLCFSTHCLADLVSDGRIEIVPCKGN